MQHLRSSKNGTDVSIILTPERLALIDALIPDFQWEAPVVMVKFEDLLTQYAQFYAETKRHARCSGKRDERELRFG